MKILYVEDSPDEVSNFERIVTHFGHEVLIAVTGEQGYALIQSQPDLLVLDIHLPDMNGLDLARRLRAEHYTLPIVALTGDVFNYDEAQALQAGCNEFMAKPYTVEALTALLEQFD